MNPQPSAAEIQERAREILRRTSPSPPAAPSLGTAEAPRFTDPIPARMLNEFVYCPRLFYYEFVEGVFADNADTIRGRALHRRVDGGSGELPPATSPAAVVPEVIHSRSVQLGSARLGVTAKLDLVEARTDPEDLFSTLEVCPVDYKAGAPRPGEDGNELWDADKMQLGLQALILRDNGYTCHEGIIYYRATKQRVRLAVTPELEQWVRTQIARARETAVGAIPPPLVNSPKCPRCSLVTICLPDETRLLSAPGTDESSLPTPVGADVRRFTPGAESRHLDSYPHTVGADVRRLTPSPTAIEQRIRRLIAARDDTRALYLNTPGLRIGRKDEVLQVKQEKQVLDEVRVNDLSHIALFGNIQISTQAIQTLCEGGVPVTYFSMGGWFYGLTRGHELKNVFLRIEQFRLARDPAAALRLARQFVQGKIRNHRTLLMRNHVEPPASTLLKLKQHADAARRAQALDELLGIEGGAAAAYFEQFSGMLKFEEERGDDGPARETREGRENGRLTEEGEQDRSPDAAQPVVGDPPSPAARGTGSGASPFRFNFRFTHRHRRPPTDPINALLSLAYSLLAKDCTLAALAVGFDPYVGFYHQPRFGRPALALDLMEEFRPLVAESAVLSCVNNRVLGPTDFVRAGDAVNLTTPGRRRFFQIYEQRMSALLTHPVFDYKVSYRRALELQARLLAKVLTGEIQDYMPLMTR